ncbi:MAG TPA: hypothetical protein VF525_10710 [Pyrinomonadaceae bacterium]
MAYLSSQSTGIMNASAYTFGGDATIISGQAASKTGLTEIVKPPEPFHPARGQSVGISLVLALIGGACAGIGTFALFNSELGEIIGWIVGFVMFVGTLLSALKYLLADERKKDAQGLARYNAALATWQRSWICLRCGSKWTL